MPNAPSIEAAKIRGAELSDYEQVAALYHRLDCRHGRLAPSFFPEDAGKRELEAYRQTVAEKNGVVLVADLEGILVGVVTVSVYDTPANPLMVPRKRGYVDELVVASTHDGQGIGKLLMEAAATWCRRRGAKQRLLTVWSGNDEAQAFYTALGYTPLNQVLGIEL